MATKKSKTPNIIECMEDEALFGHFFKDQQTWTLWKSYLSGLFALEMDPERLALFLKHTGRSKPPVGEFDKSYLVAGRRSGKSAIMAVVACYLACFRDFRQYLAKGETGRIRIMSGDLAQTRTIYDFVSGLLRESPILRSRIVRETATAIELDNKIEIETGVASFKAVRGYTLVCAICDEAAFWRSTEDSSNVDVEVLRGIEPAMLTVPHSKLLIASSPYSKRGILWDGYEKHFGKDDASALCWVATTLESNPTASKAFIDQKLEEDYESAMAEYFAQWRSDISGFIDIAALKDCIDSGVYERDVDYRNRYVAFIDPSGGRSDAFTLGIGHRTGGTVVVDVIRERAAPFSPQSVVEEYSRILKKYRINTVHSDKYAGEWVSEAFRVHGLNVEYAKPKSELYIDFLAMCNSGGVRLLDHQKMFNQFLGLERRTHRSGKDSVDHGRHGKDDTANSCAGVCVIASQAPSGWRRRDRELTIMPPEITAERYGLARSGVHERGTAWMWRR